MAPLWDSLWPAQAGDTNGSTKSDTDSHLKPSLGQILTSKRVRYTASALAVVGFFFLVVRNYDQMPTLATVRGGTASSDASTSTSVAPDCSPAVAPPVQGASVDWSQYAYTQYVTNKEYLCNSVMIFETLHRLKAKADRVMMYPENMMSATETNPISYEAKLLAKARDMYGVKLVPVSVQRRPGGDATWAESFTKLLAFNQTQYKRVVNVDSDATILQPMDELFLMPPCPVAMPRAYWLFPKDKILSSQLMLVQPSEIEFDRVMKKIDAASTNDYDMEIVNQLYADSAMILPHRPYDLLTGEFRGDNHENYLGTDREEFDPVAIYNEAKYLHFSDWPLPKPWLASSESTRQGMQPKCVTKNGQEDCSARELWNGFYKDFTQRRSTVCSTTSKTRR
ncbi:glycosyltransferase family 8 protein [Xylaria intraflava]|nr:glycosyltransferase family 8 protein [Xylaria intraflava]